MINKEKIENEFLAKFKKNLDKKEIDKVKNLSKSQRIELLELARDYYKYLADEDVSYGKLALEVVNNEGKYGLMANFHLKAQCIFDGIKEEDIGVIREQIIVSLAFHDMNMRNDPNYGQSSNYCEKINDYHKVVFEKLATPYAWGGLAMVELIGPDSWLKLYENGGGDLDAIKILFKNLKTSKDYSSGRLIDSMYHTWENYNSGVGIVDPYMSDNPFCPSVRGFSKSEIAKEYRVSEDRLLEVPSILDEPSISDMKSYKILPATQFIYEEENCESEELEEEINTKIEIQTSNILTELVLLHFAKKEKEMQEKFNKITEKIKTALEEYHVKVAKLLEDFFDKKNKEFFDNEGAIINQVSAEISQIQSDLEAKNDQLFSQKQSELNATAPDEIDMHTYILRTNERACDTKQSEYKNALAQYMAQCERKISDIESRYKSENEARKKSFESTMNEKANIIKVAQGEFIDVLESKRKEALDKISRGEDIDAILKNIDQEVADSLNLLNGAVNGGLIVNAVFEMIYDNPILNQPALLHKIYEKYGKSTTDRLINFCMELHESGDVEDFLNDLHFEDVVLLMGLEYS